MSRKMFECRGLPGECTLAISGEEDEVMRAAEHAVSVHGVEDSAALREQIRTLLKDVPAGL